tara:strand:- start:713 stop:1024 length:312 start_codon:yes stop_codon:yes gene_type:complete
MAGKQLRLKVAVAVALVALEQSTVARASLRQLLARRLDTLAVAVVGHGLVLVGLGQTAEARVEKVTMLASRVERLTLVVVAVVGRLTLTLTVALDMVVQVLLF